jgi:hypothetical protein
VSEITSAREKEAAMASAKNPDLTASLPASPTELASVSAREVSPWSPRFWSNAEQVGIHFESTAELDSAIDWLWSSPLLRDLPRAHVGANTLVVPAPAVEFFQQQGFRMTLQPIISAGDLPAEEVNRIRKSG